MSNCPNCGAPIISAKCEYCGTVHDAVKHKANIEEIKKLYEASVLTANQIRTEMLYSEALKAMRGYAGGIEGSRWGLIRKV